MANGVTGVNILLALRHVELGIKKEAVDVPILHHREEENNVRDQHQNQGAVTLRYVKVRTVLNSF